MNTIQTYFSCDGMTSLKSLLPGSCVHVIGVCGVAMAPLAVALAEQGFQVSGSDKEFYEPMAGLLRKSRVDIKQGYKSENIPIDAKLVVVGNAVTSNNPEVVAVAGRSLAYTCFPACLFDLMIRTRHSIVVAGTHGKSTTTMMGASALAALEADPSFFVGALPVDYDTGFRLGHGAFSIVEGDEYDSCFFAKVPKFLFYNPQTVIITGIEFDHADIYQNLDDICLQFRKLIELLPDGGLCVYCSDSPALSELVANAKTNSKDGKNITYSSYGVGEDAQWRVSKVEPNEGRIKATITCLGEPEFEVTLPVVGMHNLLNALAVSIALENRGFKREEVWQSLKSFKGIRRRQDVRLNNDRVTIIEDFAHHPTAVKETIRAVKGAYPIRRLVAVFEPRSNTSRRSVFKSEYEKAFSEADLVLIQEVQKRGSDLSEEILNVRELC
ncbi:MAG: hypothetical protein KDD53_05390, partial [Bdellovibrionales bacterium]|nr:hypothetical protein [Bdellovibrionales bacterium]